VLEINPKESAPPAAWLEAANHLATVVAQVSSTLHGLNNVLQVIAGNAEMLESTEGVPEGALRRAQVIGVQALRASALLGEVLTLSRVAATGLDRVDLRDIAAVALELRAYYLTKTHVDVKLEPADGVYFTIANRRRTLQIVLNLIANAERALTGSDAPRLHIRLSREGQTIVLVMEDNGSGIGPVSAPSEGFALVAANGGAPHLGIGLRVSCALAELMSGRLTIQPLAEAGGSIATLTLPAAPTI
jgi:two-component system, NtrC family, C4-dicarboxylate transport sensor histidine kinase DctB